MEKESGIDISLNDKASEIAFSYAKKSYNNDKDIKSSTKDKDFSGGFTCRDESMYSSYDPTSPNKHMNISIASDGIGTKVELAERMGKYDSLGFDLLAMVCDDLISNFYIPKFVSNILDIDYINLNIVDELMRGLLEASKEADVIISGGEIAELGNRIAGYGKNMHFNWAATAIGFKDTTGNTCRGNAFVLAQHSICAGDKVYGIKSNGFRSNGFSLARKILKESYGEDWHYFKFNEEFSWGSVLLKPSKIYTPIIKEILKSVNIKKIAHITGGGFVNNTKRILPENLSIKIKNPIEIPDYFLKLMKLGKVSKKQAETTWNMGCGMVFIVDKGAKLEDKYLDWPIQYIGDVE